MMQNFIPVKKLLFSILFFSTIFVCFPLPAFGAVMELTVTITSVKIPERAAMIFAPDRPNTEFAIGRGRIAVRKNSDGSLMGYGGTTPSHWGRYYVGGILEKDTVTTVTFPYDSNSAYNVDAEVRVKPASVLDTVGCRPDCTPISGGYIAYSYDVPVPSENEIDTYWALYYYSTEYNSWSIGGCPASLCLGNWADIGFDSNVFPSSDGTFWWRSPALGCIVGGVLTTCP
jgi:hypothetical protein